MDEVNYIFKILFAGNYQFYLEMMLAMLVVSINFNKRKYFWFTLPFAIVIGFPFYFMPRIAWLGLDFAFLIVFAAVSVVSIFLYKEPFHLVVLNAAIAFGLQHVTWNMMYAFLDLLPNGEDIPKYGVILIYLSAIIIFYASAFLILYIKKFRIKNIKRNIFVYLLGLLMLLVTFILSQNMKEWNVITRIYTSLSALLCILLLYAYPYALESLRRQKDLEQEKATLEKLIELQAHENEIYRESREILNIRTHDMKHQLDVLASIDNREDFIAYLEEIKKNVNVYDAYAKTGNNIVDIVLTQKSLICTSKNIRFTYIVDGEALKMFSNNDIASLLGNILDNAIEASEQEVDEYRLIKLNVFKTDKFLVISESNYTRNKPVFLDNLPKTSKKDEDVHGYGLKSIKYISNKYNGEMNIDFSNDTFRIELVFPLN